jgi:serine/threonine-protein kinase HipA
MNRIWVYAAWQELDEPRVIGYLHRTLTRGQEVLSFEYEDGWLLSPFARELDPALRLFSGLQYPRADKPNFGVFLDSSPDRWGRFVQDRREAQLARSEGRPIRKLQATDYLLGVHDLQRVGGLRIKVDPAGPFLDDHSNQAAPPWAQLPELERAAREIDRGGSRERAGYSKWLALLVAPGGSLGGARPKAGVIDSEGHLCIAKFPSRTDKHDVGGWELVANRLASDAGVTVAPSTVRRLGSKRHTFLTRRFDRTQKGERIHFASAMTLLDRNDGDDASGGASYLEMAELLERQGAAPLEDLHQLWRRIAFNICISNSDDHLRNHGFLLTASGWRLSPAYDMNPIPFSDGLKLLISESDNSLDLDLALEVAEFFRLNRKAAGSILDQVVEAVSNWRSVAHAVGVPASEMDEMADAFRLAETSL